MAVIELITEIQAPIERCFDLSRSIDLHMASTAKTGECAIAGVTKGLIGEGEEVTWRAKHFGFWQNLTSRITAFDRPYHFRDSLVRGAFKRFDHDHYFEAQGKVTLMKDMFDFESPFGLIGKIVDQLVLIGYMKRLLIERNQFIKSVAESNDWQQFLLD